MKKRNEYKFLVVNGKPATEGVDTLHPGNVNTHNEDGDTPSQVALQAGHVAELEAVLKIPGCNPTLLSLPGRDNETYLRIYENQYMGDPDTAQRMRGLLKDATDKWDAAHPQRSGGPIPPHAKKMAELGF